MVDIVEDPLDLARLIDWARDDSDGAVVSFLGVVRDFAEGRSVAGMEYHCYIELARREMEALEAEASRRWPIGRISLVHRIGPLNLGEASVAIVVASPHRAEAFDACRYLIDALKESVPIWKREIFKEGDPEWVKGVVGRPVSETTPPDSDRTNDELAAP